MITRIALSLLALAFLGCASSASRPVDQAHFRENPGWIVAAPTVDVRQASDVDCGPAVLAMIAARWSIHLTIEQASEAVPPSEGKGVRLESLRAATRELGLVSFAVHGDRKIILHELKAGRPVIVGLLVNPEARDARGHYEVVAAFNPLRDEVATLDPASGFRLWTWAALSQAWQAAGRPALVVLGPEGSVRRTSASEVRCATSECTHARVGR